MKKEDAFNITTDLKKQPELVRLLFHSAYTIAIIELCMWKKTLNPSFMEINLSLTELLLIAAETRRLFQIQEP